MLGCLRETQIGVLAWAKQLASLPAAMGYSVGIKKYTAWYTCETLQESRVILLSICVKIKFAGQWGEIGRSICPIVYIR